ncbi:FMN-binding protein MioC [Gallaecimonas sp. GXIMD1310]|uniref:FMN-binding protein MioC n=1 Tax=Gallaecimonas sp. GXIMD1310 TaxID=3131926 RepID=UPI00324E82BC
MDTVHLIVGSTLGAAEYVADALATELANRGINHHLYLEPQLVQLPPQGYWLLVSSTHGAGELPDNIQPFAAELATEPDLSAVKYAVFALGDSSYDTFCEGGKTLDTLMQTAGASRLWPMITLDVLDETLPEDRAVAYLIEQI